MTMDPSRYVGKAGASYVPSQRSSGVCVEMLPQLRGRPWDAVALALVSCLKPSHIRVNNGEVHTDSHVGRVTVILDKDGLISIIEQELSVDLPDSIRDGYHLQTAIKRRVSEDLLPYMLPSPHTVINEAAIAASQFDSVTHNESFRYVLHVLSEENNDTHEFLVKSPIVVDSRILQIVGMLLDSGATPTLIREEYETAARYVSVDPVHEEDWVNSVFAEMEANIVSNNRTSSGGTHWEIDWTQVNSWEKLKDLLQGTDMRPKPEHPDFQRIKHLCRQVDSAGNPIDP